MSMYKCPECGSTRKFNIIAMSLVEVDGENGYVEDHDGFEWERNSYCSCADCYYEGECKDFEVEQED